MKKITILLLTILPFLGFGQSYFFDFNTNDGKEGWVSAGLVFTGTTPNPTMGYLQADGQGAGVGYPGIRVPLAASSSVGTTPTYSDYTVVRIVAENATNFATWQLLNLDNGNNNIGAGTKTDFNMPVVTSGAGYSTFDVALPINPDNTGGLIDQIGFRAKLAGTDPTGVTGTLKIDQIIIINTISVNIVTNPDFESGGGSLSSWSSSGPDVDVASLVTGNGGGSAGRLTFNQTATNNNFLDNVIYSFGQVLPAQTVTANFDMKSNRTDVEIQILFDTYLSGAKTGNNSGVTTAAFADTWEAIELPKSVETSFDEIHFRFKVKNTPDGVLNDYFDIDNVVVNLAYYDLTPATPIALATTGVGTSWNDVATWVGGVLPSITHNVQIDHQVNVNNDEAANNVTVSSTGQLALQNGSSLTLTGNLINEDDDPANVIIRNNSNTFSSLIVDGTITGNIRHRRFINGLNGTTQANDLISPAVTVSSFASFGSSGLVQDSGSDAVLFGIYNNNTPDYEYFLSTDTTPLNPGTGYVIGASADPGALFNFEGTVTTGQVDVSITDPTGGSPWNLIGNPYPSYIDFELFFTTANKAQLDSGIYQAIYGYDGNASDGWTTWNQAKIDDDITYPELHITPGQGFFVRAKVNAGTVPDDTQISFTPAMRTFGTSNDFITTSRIANVDVALAKLQLAKGSDIFTTDIYFNSNATRGLDPGYDAGAYQGNAAGFFTELVEGNTGFELVIQALAYDDFNDVVVPLGIKASTGEQISVGLDAVSNLPGNINVYLEDNVANSWTLLNTVDYTFTPSVDLSGTGRFFVHFTTSTLSAEENVFNGLQIYMDQPSRVVRVKGQLAADTKAIIYDIQGRKVLEQLLINDTTDNSIHVNSLNTGIYLVQLNNRTQNRTQKVIIR